MIGPRMVSAFGPEDLILYKLIAWRLKDRSAIQSILVMTPSVDRAYLRDWAARLDVTKRLEESFADADAFWQSPGP